MRVDCINIIVIDIYNNNNNGPYFQRVIHLATILANLP